MTYVLVNASSVDVASTALASRKSTGPVISCASKREKANDVASAAATSYMAASPSIAPSAIAAVVKWPSAGYSSTLPQREAVEENDWPTRPCGRDREAALSFA